MTEAMVEDRKKTTATEDILGLLREGPKTVNEILEALPSDHPARQSSHPQGYIRWNLSGHLSEGRVGKTKGEGNAMVWFIVHDPDPAHLELEVDLTPKLTQEVLLAIKKDRGHVWELIGPTLQEAGFRAKDLESVTPLKEKGRFRVVVLFDWADLEGAMEGGRSYKARVDFGGVPYSIDLQEVTNGAGA